MMVEVFASVLLVIGGLFGLTGAFGLLKLRAPMQRLHAPTKATTLGVGATLLASALLAGSAGWHEVLVAVFLFLTAPLTALYLAKAHLHGTVDRNVLPPTGTGADWAGFTPPQE